MPGLRLVRCAVPWGIAVVVGLSCSLLKADAISVDTFLDAQLGVFVFPLLDTAPGSLPETGPSILGGERELTVTPIGPTDPPATSVKVHATTGIDEGYTPEGVLEVGTQDYYSAQAVLLYDGEESSGLGGVDFTGGGRNNRIAFSYSWIAALGDFRTRVTITDTEGRQIEHVGTFPDDGATRRHEMFFADFTGDSDVSLEAVDSLEILLNLGAVPNADFALDNIEIVPEPATSSLLAVGLLAMAVYGRRRRLTPTTKP